MPGTPLERFEVKFTPLLVEARQLPALLWELVDGAAPEGVPGNVYPAATVLRLNCAAMVQYHAAVAALADPETALGSLSLLRSLIEAWAHLYFIFGPGVNGDKPGAPCRAIRLEQGLDQDAYWLAKSAGPAALGEVTKAERRKQELEEDRNRLGCKKGGWRGYGDVDQTVKEMAKSIPGLGWLEPLWRSASQAVHNAGWDWLFKDQGDGTSALTYPPPSHRATRLNHLVILYHNVGQASLSLVGSTTLERFKSAALAVIGDGFLKRAIDGDYD